MKFILIFLFLSIPSLLYSATPDEKLHNECLYPTVKIIDKQGGAGTGVIIRSTKVKDYYCNVVLTCAHVLHSSDIIVNYPKYENWSTFKEYEELKAVIYLKCLKNDAAFLICLSEKELPVAKITYDEQLYIGTDILKIGCGLGDEPRLDYGKITSLKCPIGVSPKEALRTSAHTIPGDSGGPVFYDNKVIGICQAVKMFPGQHSDQMLPNISFTVPAKRIKDWVVEENCVNLINNGELPVIPQFQLKMSEIKIKRNNP